MFRRGNNLEHVIARLKTISENSSREKIRLIQASVKNIDNIFASIDEEQREHILDVLSDVEIRNPDEYFASHNLLFFYGYDATSVGTMHQMFLYEIANQRPIAVKIRERETHIQWITAGRRLFHGVLDFLQEEKTGAISLSDGRVVYFNDGEAMRQDVFKYLKMLRGETLANHDIRKLVLTQWTEQNGSLSSDDIVQQYEDSLILHEGAHNLFDEVFCIEKHSLNEDARVRHIYDKETERFAILSQMAFGPLPAYTLYTFLGSILCQDSYADVILGISQNFIESLHKETEKYPNAQPRIHASGEYDIPGLLSLFNVLKSEQIRQLSADTFDRSFGNLLTTRVNRWDVDYERRCMISYDCEGKVISR